MCMTIMMIAIGGVTRMTRSGLSIVEWKPISGIIPPLSETEWDEQFQLYRRSPEFQQVNQNFQLSDYKKIFFWEYFHRLWGRLIFLVSFFIGIVLWIRKKVELKIVLTISLLVLLQGVLGWVMVKSGLNKDPMVSPYLLALHFISANIVFLYIYAKLKELQEKVVLPHFQGVAKKVFYGLGVLIFVQIIYGGLVSGFRAGHSFNTWPLMGDDFFPPGGLRLEPWWMNIFENPAAIQWIHRWLAFLIFAFLILFGRFLKEDKKQIRGMLMHMHANIGVQIVLGILNIIFAVPILLASLHQVMAVFIIMGYANIYFKVKSR